MVADLSRALNLKLHTALMAVDWRDPYAAEETGVVLQDLGVDFLFEVVSTAIVDPSGEISPCIREMSVRKPTHVKWYLGGAPPDSFRHAPQNRQSYVIWGNDYGQPMPNRGPYIEDWHDHRGHFASIQIGKKGFVEDRIEPVQDKPKRVDENGLWVPDPEDWQNIRTREFTRGDVMVINGRTDIHRVTESYGAMSFLVQGPRVRDATRVFGPDGTAIEYPGFHRQDYETVNRLRQLSGHAPLTWPQFLRQYYWVGEPDLWIPDTGRTDA